LTFGEIRRGIEKLPLGKRRTHLETWLAKDLHEWFENRLLVIDEAIANRWGILATAAQRTGTPLAIIDGLLSATAIEHKLTVLTRNSSDFVNAGVSVLNPWQI
jgi:toxin FitB